LLPPEQFGAVAFGWRGRFASEVNCPTPGAEGY
jgi:hypothetical protein